MNDDRETTIHEQILVALDWADGYLGDLDDEGARAVRQKIVVALAALAELRRRPRNRAALAQLRAERDALREALRRLHDAVWEYDGPASEEMDAAAGEAMAVLGDVISLAPVPEEETT